MDEPVVGVETISGGGHSDPNLLSVTAATQPQSMASGR
jgi:hypothetical protein